MEMLIHNSTKMIIIYFYTVFKSYSDFELLF